MIDQLGHGGLMQLHTTSMFTMLLLPAVVACCACYSYLAAFQTRCLGVDVTASIAGNW